MVLGGLDTRIVWVNALQAAEEGDGAETSGREIISLKKTLYAQQLLIITVTLYISDNLYMQLLC